MPVQMERECRDARFLRQDMQFIQNGEGGGSRKSSLKSDGSERSRWSGNGGEELGGLGGWCEGVGLGIWIEGGYPLVMSGLSERVSE